MYACIEFFERGVNGGIDGKLVAAGVHAELEICGQAEGGDGISDGCNIERKLVLELRYVADIIDAFVEAAAEFRRYGLDGNAFGGDGSEDDEQLDGALSAVGFVHRDLGDEVAFALD